LSIDKRVYRQRIIAFQRRHGRKRFFLVLRAGIPLNGSSRPLYRRRPDRLPGDAAVRSGSLGWLVRFAAAG
jgi:hypothetical protein